MVNLRVDPTPNPNSIKVTLDCDVINTGNFSASSALEAEGNEVAKALFALGSVTNVFLIKNFISVNKDAGTSWDDLQPKIKEIIRTQFGG